MIFGLESTGCARLLPRFTFRIPACEHGLEALSNYHAVRATSTGLAGDEPVDDWATHASSALKVIAEAETAGMLPAPARPPISTVGLSRFGRAFAAMHGTTPVPPTSWIASSASRDETCA